MFIIRGGLCSITATDIGYPWRLVFCNRHGYVDIRGGLLFITATDIPILLYKEPTSGPQFVPRAIHLPESMVSVLVFPHRSPHPLLCQIHGAR